MKLKKTTVGMRNIKTATAVMLCIILTRVLAFIGENANFGFFEGAYDFLFVRQTPLYSSLAALVAVGSTMKESYKTGLSRILGTLMGGAFAVLHIRLTQLVNRELFYYATVFVFIVAIIYISTAISHNEITATSGMIFLIIIFSIKDEPPFIYAVHRLIDTVGGVIVAVAVNKATRTLGEGQGPRTKDRGM